MNCFWFLSCHFICRLTLVTLWFSKNTKFNVHLKIAFSFCFEITVWTWDCFTFIMFMNSFDVHLKIIFPSRFVITVWTWEGGRCFSLWLMWFDVCHITGPLSGFEITTLTLKCFTLMVMFIWVSYVLGDGFSVMFWNHFLNMNFPMKNPGLELMNYIWLWQIGVK